MAPKLRALVLAAGYGTRLAPLTDRVPKPLIPVRGLPILTSTLERLAAVGCEAVALNLHHLGDQIRQGLGDEQLGMKLHYSEEPEILGTLGALAPLKEFFAEADLGLLINGDSFCRWPLERMVRRHMKSDAVATMLFTSRPDPARFGGGVKVDVRAGRVLSFDKPTAEETAATASRRGLRGQPRERRLVFAGAHVLSKEVIERAPHEFSGIVSDLYKGVLAEGRTLGAVVTHRPWHDLGTPRRLIDAVSAGAGAPPALRHLYRVMGRSWVGEGVRVGHGVSIGRSVVESGVTLGDGVRLTRCLVLPGAQIGDGAELHHCLVGFDAQVPAGARIEDRLIAHHEEGDTIPEGCSRLGDELYCPLDPQKSK